MNTHNIDNLIIEVTRKCNLKCLHCLRGKAQNKDISSETIEKFLVDNDIEFISTVTFTGGEPTLNISAINDFINICVTNNIEVGSFYIVVNGVKIPDEFILTVSRLYAFCTDNDISAVEVSESDFYLNQDDEQIKKLELFKIFSRKQTTDDKNLILEGNAIDYIDDFYDGRYGREINISDSINEIFDDLDTSCVGGIIYLNVNGDIITHCDLSYDNQDKHKIGNVYESTLNDMLTKLYDETQ